MERTQISLIKVLLRSYYGISSKTVQDLSTKAIWHYMISRAKADLQKELTQAIYKEQLFAELLRENEQVRVFSLILLTHFYVHIHKRIITHHPARHQTRAYT